MPAFGPDSPPKPPSPRRKSEKRLVKSGLPASSEVSTWSTTSAAFPLSQISAIFALLVMVASGGMGACTSRSCSPWSSIAKLNSRPGTLPRLPIEPKVGMTPKLGSTLRFFS